MKAKKAFAPALKTATNPHFRSKYADLGACFEAVNDALLDAGIAVYQETTPDEAGVTVETVLLHESGETIRSGKLHVPAGKMDAQGYGSALTYARRYSLMAACGIAPEDDDGNAASKKAPEKPVDDRWASERADWIAVIADAESYEVAKVAYTKAIHAAKEHDDLKAAEGFKSALMGRKDVPARAA